MSLPSHEGLLPLHWLCEAALTTSCFPHPCPPLPVETAPPPSSHPPTGSSLLATLPGEGCTLAVTDRLICK